MEGNLAVVYIAGMGRSGSTVLDQFLGARPGYFSVGEIAKIWRYGVLEDWLCACGAPFSACTFWSSVRRYDPTLLTKEAAWAITRYQHRTLDRLMYPFWTRRGRQRIAGAAPIDVLRRLRRLYRAVAQVSGCSVIVDSSKHPGYALLLTGADAVPIVRFIQLVRDPRAAAYSWLHPKVDVSAPRGRAQVAEAVSPVRSSAMWMEWNVTTELVGRSFQEGYALLRYEDFAADPSRSLQRLGLPGDSANGPIEHDAATQVGWHTVYGNPARMRTGPIVVRIDDAWRERMPERDILTVSLICAPLLRRYGYRLKP